MSDMACELLRAMYGEAQINIYRWRGAKKDAPELPFVRYAGEKFHGFAGIKKFVSKWNGDFVRELPTEATQAS